MKACLNCKTENPDDAKYCQNCRFTLDWATTTPDEADDKTVVLPPPTLELALGPGEVRVAAGGQAEFGVRVVNRGGLPGRARLLVAGAAAAHSTVTPPELALEPGAAGDARLTVAVPRDARGGTFAVDVYATEASGGGTGVAAQALLTVDPLPPPPAPLVPKRPGGRRAVGVLAGLAIVALGVVGVDWVSDNVDVIDVPVVPDDGHGGQIDTVTPGEVLCLRREPTTDGSTVVPAGEETDEGNRCSGLRDGTDIRIDCEVGGFVRLKEPNEGRFVSESRVDVEDDPPTC